MEGYDDGHTTAALEADNLSLEGNGTVHLVNFAGPVLIGDDVNNGVEITGRDLDADAITATAVSVGGKPVVTRGDTAWTALTLANGWVQDTANSPAGAGDAVPAYFKDAAGIVHVRGYIKSGTAVAIATLPAGYRPTLTFESPSLRSSTGVGAVSNVRVSTAGVIDVLTNFASAQTRLTLWFSFPTL